MKRLALLAILITFHFSLLTSIAQPSWTKKATKSVFTLKTFDADGTLLGTATGFYVGTNGEALSCFAPFKGAVRALVVDAAGKEHAVDCMLGANETYDVARFRVDATKTQPLDVAPGMAPEQTQLWLLPWRETKNLPQGTVTKTETFQQEYGYYTVTVGSGSPASTTDIASTADIAGTPLLDDEGLVVAIMQRPYKDDKASYAVSARFADSLRISGLSINDPVLRSTQIKKALPDDIAQAQLTLYVASAQMDSAAYASLIDDFIAKFPKTHEGYVARAQLAADGGNYDLAERDMAVALRVTDHPDDVHYSFSRMIYRSLPPTPSRSGDSAAEASPSGGGLVGAWTLDRALSEAQSADAANPQPVYRQQQAVVMAAQKRYAEAYAIYEGLFSSSLRSPELFYEASQCKAQAGDTLGRIALLDSCLTFFSKPYLKEAAPFLLANAQARIDAARYREGVVMLNDYEKLMSAQVNDRFYYLRFQTEVSGRLFQQALNDIDKAISMDPQSDLYYAEKASLQVRLGLYDEAAQTARESICIAPDHSDGYLFLGLAQCLKGDKEEGVKNLLKAKELGDPQADGLIEKYGMKGE